MGLTRSHFVVHSLKILKKYNLTGLMVPVLGLSFILSLLPPYLTAGTFIVSTGYLAFIIFKKNKPDKEKHSNV